MKLVEFCFVILTLSFSDLGFSKATGDFQPFTFKSSSGQTLPFRLLVPLNYDSKVSYPMVVWLHGAGERGNDNSRQLVNGVQIFDSRESREAHPAFVLVPQCPVNDRWSNMSSHLAPGRERMSELPTRTAQSTFELITELKKLYAIDPQRISAVGLSLGGFGVWDWIVRRPDIFSKGLPMSGGGDTRQAAHLRNTRIWDFHGSNDDIVNVEHSRVMIRSIRAAGGDPRYTEIPRGGHGPWDTIVARPEVLDWLFSEPVTRF